MSGFPSALERLTAGFKPSRDHATIAENRKLIHAARDEANAIMSMAQALSRTNRSLCDHKGARSYTDRDGSSGIDCAHCGGD